VWWGGGGGDDVVDVSRRAGMGLGWAVRAGVVCFVLWGGEDASWLMLLLRSTALSLMATSQPPPHHLKPLSGACCLLPLPLAPIDCLLEAAAAAAAAATASASCSFAEICPLWCPPITASKSSPSHDANMSSILTWLLCTRLEVQQWQLQQESAGSDFHWSRCDD